MAVVVAMAWWLWCLQWLGHGCCGGHGMVAKAGMLPMVAGMWLLWDVAVVAVAWLLQRGAHGS